jgi:hypothetical protein
MPDSLAFADLSQEREIRIGEETVPSAYNGYSENYYIGRTLNHCIVIKQDTL